MKKILTFTAFILFALTVKAQVKIGNNPNTVNPNAVLELETANKGILYPRVALTATTNPAPLTAHVQGMAVYNTATTADVVPGVYINDGTRWQPYTEDISAGSVATVIAECNGFTGNYSNGTATRTFTVTFTNNSFTTAQVTPSVSDLVLNPASGLTVVSVSPSVATTINSGESLLVTYTLGGTLSAPVGTVITGTFTKLNLSCSSTVTVGNSLPVANAGTAQTIILPNTTSVTLTGSGSDADGPVTYSWAHTGGTGAATPVIASPTAATTNVTGLNTEGTYVFTLTVTDNTDATVQSSVTVTATFIPTVDIVTTNGTLTFMTHNLGADYAADPNTPAQAIHGNLYVGGTNVVAATAADGAGTPAAGWINYPMLNSSPPIWNEGTEAAPVKAANDPCPAGFRLPTAAEFSALVYNTPNISWSNEGSFTDSATNYSSAKHLLINGVVTMTFPTAGQRSPNDGNLSDRGERGGYWTSMVTCIDTCWMKGYNKLSVNATGVNISTSTDAGGNAELADTAISIRCIQE